MLYYHLLVSPSGDKIYHSNHHHQYYMYNFYFHISALHVYVQRRLVILTVSVDVNISPY